MVNSQLSDYVRQQLQQGRAKDEIKSELLRAGWQEIDINQALDAPGHSTPPTYPSPYNFPSGAGITATAEGAPVYYAGFWKRFAALIIDIIILVAGGIIISIIYVIITARALLGDAGADVSIMTLVATGVGYVLAIVLYCLYFTLFESSSKQATPGKMAVGIVVTDLSGRRISFGRANGRYWSKIASSVLFIGYIMAGFTQKKQALHDIVAETLVVKK